MAARDAVSSMAGDEVAKFVANQPQVFDRRDDLAQVLFAQVGVHPGSGAGERVGRFQQVLVRIERSCRRV